MNTLDLKVDSISSLTDARYCAGMGVQKLGIFFEDDGKASIDLNGFLAVRGWIEGVHWTGVYKGSDFNLLQELSTQFDISEWVVSVQILENLHAEELDGLSLIIIIDDTELKQGFDFSLVSGFEISAMGEVFKSSFDTFLKQIPANKPVYISDISDPELIIKIHQKHPQFGFSLFSGAEERPGWMDLSELQDVLERLEEI